MVRGLRRALGHALVVAGLLWVGGHVGPDGWLGRANEVGAWARTWVETATKGATLQAGWDDDELDLSASVDTLAGTVGVTLTLDAPEDAEATPTER